MTQAKVLIVEDDRDGCLSLSEAIRDLGFHVTVAMSGNDGVKAFRGVAFDAVLSDLVLPDISGLEVLSRVRALDEDVPVLIMTAYGTVSSAVDALKAGAYDYLTKPLDLDDVQSKVSRAVETRRLRGQVKHLSEEVSSRYSARRIVATSRRMRDVIAQIEALAKTNATVLVLGESGTGKELVARALHADGKRAAGPFVAVNCGAFAETLLDSELFGHERGAFTGATQQHKGAFERADGGTLFLDEIGNAPASVQIKLLRVLEEKEFFRIGGQNAISVDVRLVSASNRDLDAMVRAGQFRDDLLYRLKVVTISLPSLRERREDIRPLADHFIARACEEHGRKVTSVAPGYYEALECSDWPGNVRELRNAVEASIVTSSGLSLQASDLRLGSAGDPADGGLFVPDGMTMAQIEKRALEGVLTRCNGNRTLAADKLGLSRWTIQRKIQEYNLPF
jgi:DNA-binding NtrC family response regulator